MPERKIRKGYRLSPGAVALLEKLTKKLGISQTSVIEQAIRKLAERENIKLGSGGR